MLLVKEKDGQLDEYFDKAVKACVQYDVVSAGFLQRRLVIGYARAARLLDQLEYAGIVSSANGLEPRRVLIQKRKTFSKEPGKQDTKDFLLANAQLIIALLGEHNIAVKLVRVTVQKENILFLFDFDIRTKIDDILKLEKEIATVLASPTGKVEMGAPFKGTSLLFIYLPTVKKMKEETYLAFDIDVKNIKRDSRLMFRRKVSEMLWRLSGFLDELAYKI